MDVLHAVAAQLGHHGHRRMIRVELLRHARDVIHRRPDGGVVALAVTLHLVADAPHQHGRMVLVGQHDLAGGLILVGDLPGVVVTETVPFVTQPDANRDAQAELLRLGKDSAQVVGAPGAHGVAAGRRQRFREPSPPAPLMK